MIKQLFILSILLLSLNKIQAAQHPEDGVYPLKMIPTLPLKAAGLNLEASEIHNNSGSGITSSLVDFGGFTGTFLSKKGLLVTTNNEIIAASKPVAFQAADSLSKYFFASDATQELEAKGLSCEITDPYGNTIKLLDLRFVYCPITAAGLADNGAKDFILLRAYVAPDGKPATYAAENIPYTPVKTLPIYANGASMNDFIFLLGFSKAKRYQTKEELIALDQQARIDQWFTELYANNSLLRISRQINGLKRALDGQPAAKKETYFNQHLESLKLSLLSDYQKFKIDPERSSFSTQLYNSTILSPGITVEAVKKITDRNTDVNLAIGEFVNDTYGFTKLKDQKYVLGTLLKSYKTLLNYNDGLLVFENDISKQLQNTKTERENTYQLGLQNSRLLFTYGRISNPPTAFSGSPVLNAKGELVGVINNRLNMVDIRTIIGVSSGILNGESVLSELGIKH